VFLRDGDFLASHRFRYPFRAYSSSGQVPPQVVSVALPNVQAGRGSAISRCPDPNAQIHTLLGAGWVASATRTSLTVYQRNPSDLTKAFMAVLDLSRMRLSGVGTKQISPIIGLGLFRGALRA
jgi:hypothetical protein